MKRVLWIAAACFGVSTCVAFSLLMVQKSLDSFLRMLEAEPGIFWLLICLGANCAMFANDIAASKGWQGFNETRMYYGDEPSWVQTPIPQHIKLLFVYPFFIGFLALMVVVIIAKNAT
jgi:hypothetical protein